MMNITSWVKTILVCTCLLTDRKICHTHERQPWSNPEKAKKRDRPYRQTDRQIARQEDLHHLILGDVRYTFQAYDLPLSLACFASLRKAAAKLDVLVAAIAWFPLFPLVTVTVDADWLSGVTVAVVRVVLVAEVTTVRGGGLTPGVGPPEKIQQNGNRIYQTDAYKYCYCIFILLVSLPHLEFAFGRFLHSICGFTHFPLSSWFLLV